MASRDLNDLDQTLHGYAVDFLCRCRAVGLKVFIDCTYRSGAEQDELYAKGRTVPGAIVTHAQAGQSAHNCTGLNGIPAARAFDIAIYDSDGVVLDWKSGDHNWTMALNIARDMKTAGDAQCFDLGADFTPDDRDYPHIELHNWKEANYV